MKKSVILLIILLCTFAMFKFPAAMVNPGELLEGHNKIKDDCGSCHTFFKGLASEKCITCHKLSEIGKDTSAAKMKNILFHQHLAEQSCTSCHTDHIGANPKSSVKSFSHELLINSVRENCSSCHTSSTIIHDKLSKDCGSCHNTNAWMPAKFNHEMLQDSFSNCLSCHQKPAGTSHSQFENNCKQCHNTNKWTPSSFNHSAYFQLSGNHNATCNTCHTDSNYKSYTCYGCHEHSQSNLSEKHNEEGIYNFDNCISCHKSGSEHESEGGGNSNEHSGEHGGHDDD